MNQQQRCNFCQHRATHVWRYRGYLAARRKSGQTFYVYACDEHEQAGQLTEKIR